MRSVFITSKPAASLPHPPFPAAGRRRRAAPHNLSRTGRHPPPARSVVKCTKVGHFLRPAKQIRIFSYGNPVLPYGVLCEEYPIVRSLPLLRLPAPAAETECSSDRIPGKIGREIGKSGNRPAAHRECIGKAPLRSPQRTPGTRQSGRCWTQRTEKP